MIWGGGGFGICLGRLQFELHLLIVLIWNFFMGWCRWGWREFLFALLYLFCSLSRADNCNLQKKRGISLETCLHRPRPKFPKHFSWDFSRFGTQPAVMRRNEGEVDDWAVVIPPLESSINLGTKYTLQEMV